jgi:hypothetical protein
MMKDMGYCKIPSTLVEPVKISAPKKLIPEIRRIVTGKE